MTPRWKAALLTVLVAVAVGALTIFSWLQMQKTLDGLCATKNWVGCIRLISCDFSLGLPLAGGMPAALTAMRNYFLELARQKTVAQEPDSAVAGMLMRKARECEYKWNLPHLAEAYMRCSCGQYRLLAKDALLALKEPAGAIEQLPMKKNAAEKLSALAVALRNLAELYRNHGKLFIAERALKESVDVATSALTQADESTHERMHSELLVDYAAHIKVLRELGRNDQADRETLLLSQ